MENNNKLVEDYQKLKTKENDYINNINNLKKNIKVKNKELNNLKILEKKQKEKEKELNIKLFNLTKKENEIKIEEENLQKNKEENERIKKENNELLKLIQMV